MNHEPQIGRQSFIPVILGANIGVYSTARSFHEAYGSISLNICRESVGPTKHSVLIRSMIEPRMEEQEHFLASLTRIAETYPETPKILIASADWHVRMIVNSRKLLDDEWVIPYSTGEVLDRLTNKKHFYEICEELGVDYPKYVVVDQNLTETPVLPFGFPVVIKPADSVSYEMFDFPGKKKVFIARDRPELDQVVSLIREADYTGNLIVQEFVPGDDSSMHILTLYTAQDGETKLASFGQTILEDHTPGGIGNPVAIRTFRGNEVVEQAKRLVEHAGYVGFSNFDLKYDQRDGTYKFLELNARLGRSNYYVTAQGHNTSEYYVKDYLESQPIACAIGENEMLYTVVPKRLLLKYIKQQDLLNHIKTLYKSRLVRNPMNYFPVENSIRRLFYVVASTLNYFRKFKRYPPVIAENGRVRNARTLWNHRRIGAKSDR